MKPTGAIVRSGETVPYPPRTESLHYETELAVAIATPDKNIEVVRGEEYIFDYAVGVDLTRRDLQAVAMERRRPWDTAKRFECAAPITAIHRIEDFGHPSTGRICLAECPVLSFAID